MDALEKANDVQYFSGYEDLEVHELMLCDKPRQDSFYSAVMSNKELFKDKIVLDVGAGTGILSIFCAKAGAKIVYAVEASNLAETALKVVQENMCSNVVKVIQSKIEDFELPTGFDKVDIIISEWMGFYLLHEGMLDTVINARNKFLKEGGYMFPEFASIHVSPCSVPTRFDFWENVNGVQMTNFARELRSKKSCKPEIITVQADDLLHEGIVMSWMDLNEINSEDLNEINIKEVISIQKAGNYQGFCLWFTCTFPSADSVDEVVTLSTSPKMPQTHWKQCVIVLPESACESVKVGDAIAFSLSMKRNQENKRRYNLEMNLLDQDEVEHPVPCDCIMTKCILTKAHLKTLDNSQPMDSL